MDFIAELIQNNRQSINRIVELIDTDSYLCKKHPEYKDAATLCKFIYDYENKYELLAHPEEYGRFYESALDFETLCNAIYHALVDDGYICFIQTLDHLCPRIAFRNRWSLKIEDVIYKWQIEHLNRFNEFKRSKGLPVEELKLTFYNDVHEYIEAVKRYNIDAEENHKKAKEIIKKARESAK